MDSFKKGVILTSVLSLVIIISFFGSIVKSPNKYYFASGGDGFKSYYGAIYHLEYDSAYFQFQGMNYPYGESVFFTDNQPLLTNTVNLISDHILDIREHVVGIINLSMIFSILLAALCLYLLFFELGVDWWFASLASIGICLLSPQIGRMAGHFSLSHLFWIPLMLYLIFRFSKKPQWKLSILIALVGFLAASMHLYFAAFYGLLITFYWLFSKNWLKENWHVRRNALFHWFVQACFCFILLEIIVGSTDHVSDRTSHPYGTLVYLAHPISIFLPGGAPYSFVPKYISVFNHLQWEGFAFIGMVSFIGFLIGIVSMLRRLIIGRNFWEISNVGVLNSFIWASFFALLLSFGLPFIWNMDWLLDYLGPFRQLRGLGRFAWLFYYVINVTVFYLLYQWFIKQKSRSVAIAVITGAFILFFIDGYYNIRNVSVSIKNTKPLIEDRNNELAANKWMNQIDKSQFQTILPLPYFHVGSENIWIEPSFNSLENTLIASLKSGLPTTAVMMGRTSISQTYLNYSLVMEPLHSFDILNDFKNRKDILLMCMKGYQPNKEEQRLQNASSFLVGNDLFDLYRLPFDSLKQLPDKYHRKVIADFYPAQLISKGAHLLSDTNSFVHYVNFDEEVNPAYTGAGAHSLRVSEWNGLFDQKLMKAKRGDTYLVSFWLQNYRTDAYPRFNIEMAQVGADGQTVDYFYSDIHRYIRATDKNWALFEIPISVKEDDVLLKIAINNRVLRKANYIMDEFLIRKSDNNVFQQSDLVLIKNTRKFSIK